VLPVLRYSMEDLSDSLKATTVHGVCNFSLTEYAPYPMDYYYCNTCWKDTEKVCCITCSRLCHKGHLLICVTQESGLVCDCWSHTCVARKAKGKRIEWIQE